MTAEEMDEPIPDAEAAELVAGTVAVETGAKLETLHALLGSPESVMLDVDQTVFGVVAEVLSRVGGWMVRLPRDERFAVMRRCYGAGMAVAKEWARRRGLPAEIGRAAGGRRG